MKNVFIVMVAAILGLTACKNDGNKTERLTIASEKRIGMGVVPMECYLVKHEGEQSWGLFYSQIEGFDYQEGNEYVIVVELVTVENPPADASSVRYILKKVVSKTEKHSEGMPESRFSIE